MKNIQYLLLAFLLCACTLPPADGIYKTDDGWTIVKEGISYTYEVDNYNIYLFTEDPPESTPTITLTYNTDIYLPSQQQTGHRTHATFSFDQKCADGKYAFYIPLKSLDGHPEHLYSVELNDSVYLIDQDDNMEIFTYLIEYMKQ